MSSRYRLRASPGNSGAVTGTLRRRHGDDFRLVAVIAGLEWELPSVKHLVAQARAALPVEWAEIEVTLTCRWRRLDVEPPAFPWSSTWHLRKRSAARPLQLDELAPSPVKRFSADD